MSGRKITIAINDVFAIQSEIAKAIADQLQAKLSPNGRKLHRKTADNRRHGVRSLQPGEVFSWQQAFSATQ